MRTASISSLTKILPSPTWPVCAERHDRVQNGLHVLVRHHDFHLNFRDEVDRVLGAAVHFGMPLLAAEPANFGNGHPLNAMLGERDFLTSSNLKCRMIASIFFIQ